jgi:O-antigen ligase
LSARFAQTPAEEQSLGERQLLNQSANQIFAAQPLTGAGLGAFPLALKAQFPDFPVSYQPAHFVLLDVASEIGVFGALFYLVLLVAPWLALFFWRKQLKFTPSLVAATALLLAVSVVGLFDYYPWLLVPGRMWSWLAWGFWGSAFLSARKTAGGHV